MSELCDRPALIWCPFGSPSEARRVAGRLLEEGLVACANILPPMVSLFAWQGELSEAEEVGALFKTNAAMLERAIERLAELHSYDTPAIIGWGAQASTAATTAWLAGLQGEGPQE